MSNRGRIQPLFYLALVSIGGAGAALLFNVWVVSVGGLSLRTDMFFVALIYPSVATAITSQVQITVGTFISSPRCAPHERDGVLLDTAKWISKFCVAVSLFSVACNFGLRLLGDELSGEIHLLLDYLLIFEPIILIQGITVAVQAKLLALGYLLSYRSQSLTKFGIAILAMATIGARGSYDAAVGFTLGSIMVPIVALTPLVWNEGFKRSLSFLRLDTLEIEKLQSTTNKAKTLALSSMKALTIRQTSLITDRLIALLLPVGAVSIVAIASKLQGPLSTVLHGTVITEFVPKLELDRKLRTKDNIVNLKFGSSLIWYSSIIAVVAMIVLKAPIISLLFGSSVATLDDLQRIGPVFVAYMVGLIPRGAFTWFTAIAYKLKDGNVVINAYSLLTGLDLLLKSGLAVLAGTLGLAIGATGAYVASAAYVIYKVVILGHISLDYVIPNSWRITFMLICSLILGSALYEYIHQRVLSPEKIGLPEFIYVCIIATISIGYIIMVSRQRSEEEEMQLPRTNQ